LVTDLRSCDVMDPKLAGLIAPLGDMLASLSIAERMPQMEAAVGDSGAVLVLRVLSPPSDADMVTLAEFEDRHGIRFYLQPGRVESAVPLRGNPVDMRYHLPESDVGIHFLPSDFIQVNGEINRKLVQLALSELDLQAGDRALDLFCGLGNFTLPMARVAASVTGVEGEMELVAQGRRNAEANRIANTVFAQADLFAAEQPGEWARQRYDRILLDPPRAGAQEIIAKFPAFHARRMVYVSCHPATLARDVKLLAEQGWRMTKAGVLDMFPHTSHVESIAVFDRGAA